MSIIIPTHNRASYLREAIESVLRQSLSDWELIIVDDGSSDDTSRVVCSFGDARISSVRTEGLGPAGARNVGIGLVRSEYVAFLDDDDRYLPDKLAVQYEKLTQGSGLDWVSCGLCYADSLGRFICESRPWEAVPRLSDPLSLFRIPATPSGVMVRREWLASLGGFDSETEPAEDTDLWLRLAVAGCRMGWARDVLLCYRVHPGNVSGSVQRQRDGQLRVLDKLYAAKDLPHSISVRRDEIYSDVYLRYAIRQYELGMTAEATVDLKRALSLHQMHADHGGAAVVGALECRASDPLLLSDPLVFATNVLRQISTLIRVGRSERRRMMSRLAMSAFFRSYESRDWEAVRRTGFAGLVADPRWILNRGVVCIWIEACLGGWWARQLRAAYRSLRRLGVIFQGAAR